MFWSSPTLAPPLAAPLLAHLGHTGPLPADPRIPQLNLLGFSALFLTSLCTLHSSARPGAGGAPSGSPQSPASWHSVNPWVRHHGALSVTLVTLHQTFEGLDAFANVLPRPASSGSDWVHPCARCSF